MAATSPVAEISMRWLRGLEFEGGAAGKPAILVDGDKKVATSPVELLLLSAAACTASDIVMILQKQRVTLEALSITVRGTRREQHPRRYTAIAYHVAARGDGLDEVKLRRAVDLSVEKYCSVVASLAPDIAVSYDVTIA